jgi:hypothetical protein
MHERWLARERDRDVMKGSARGVWGLGGVTRAGGGGGNVGLVRRVAVCQVNTLFLHVCGRERREWGGGGGGGGAKRVQEPERGWEAGRGFRQDE